MAHDACRSRISKVLQRGGTGFCWYVLILPVRRIVKLTKRLFLVWRFRRSTAVTADAPLSEPSQRITAQSTSADPEKEDEVKIETVNHSTANATDDPLQQAVAVPIEEERFEWREVVRGLTEIQVWLTAIAYMGIIVPLYSFSLFLCV